MTEIDTKTIIESEAFRALNVLIDETAFRLRMYANDFIPMVVRMSSPSYPERVRVRTHEEGGSLAGDVLLDINLSDLSNVEYYIKEIRSLKTQIDNLQVFKLELLNDYDFTKGDDSTQKAVFLGLPNIDEAAAIIRANTAEVEHNLNVLKALSEGINENNRHPEIKT